MGTSNRGMRNLRADEPEGRTAFDAVRSLKSSRWVALPVLLAGTFMIVTDFFIVNVAFPSIQSTLNAGPSSIEWVVAGYGLAFASFLIAAGRIGDQIGRRRVLTAGLATFVLSSLACGAAPSPAVLVGARLVQGLAAAMISPSVLAIIGVTYVGIDRVRAISAYGLTLGLAAIGGQLIGGLLIHWNIAGLGWRTIFLVNVPVGIVAIALALRFVPETRAERARRLDLFGLILVTLGLTAFLLPLIEGPEHGWPALNWLSFVVAIVLLSGFSVHQRWLIKRGGDPLIDVRLFGQPSVGFGLAAQLALWSSVASFFLVLALYLQRGRGLDPLHAGLVFTILAGAFVVATLRAPAMTLRFGRSLIAAGALMLATGFVLLWDSTINLGVGSSIWALVPGLLLVGAGQGLTMTPLTSTVLAHAGKDQAGIVSGVNSSMQQVGNALGVAITGAIFFGALPVGGYAHAFAASLIELAILALMLFGLANTLPKPSPSSRRG
jgi:EmrB/QacA subfamily drug resistance transporter